MEWETVLMMAPGKEASVGMETARAVEPAGKWNRSQIRGGLDVRPTLEKGIRMFKLSPWNWRSTISFLLLFSMIILFFSGVFLYVAPIGRIAHQTGWQILGFDKDGWEAIHDLFGFFFIFLTLVHLWLNRRAIICYLQNRARTAFRMKKELITAGIITGMVFLIAATRILPI